ncbi:MAG: hypothetical protein AAF211_19695 [Myxococcota bacterium]
MLLTIVRGASLAGPQGLLPVFLESDRAFDPAPWAAAWHVVLPEGFVLGILALGGTCLYHLVLYADLVAGESDADGPSSPN